MRLLRVLIVLVLAISVSSDAFAQRREGLGGKHSARYTTAAAGHTTVIVGPSTTQLLGETLGGGPFSFGQSGGLSFVQFDLANEAGIDLSSDMNIMFNAGAAYGVTPELEVGAMVAPLMLSPDFEYGNPSIFATYAMTMGKMDVGVRATGYIPVVEDSDFIANVGIPFTMRSGNNRLEAGLFIPMYFGDETVLGLNIPVRVSMNFTPKVFAGLKTGYMDASFDGENDTSIPLGLFGGYTMIMGGKVIDIMASFDWNNFFYVGAPDGVEALQPGNFAIGLGANIQM